MPSHPMDGRFWLMVELVITATYRLTGTYILQRWTWIITGNGQLTEARRRKPKSWCSDHEPFPNYEVSSLSVNQNRWTGSLVEVRASFMGCIFATIAVAWV